MDIDFDFKAIKVNKNSDRQEFRVQVAYFPEQFGNDSDKGEVWQVDIHAASNEEAIQNALRIVTIERAIIMTDYVTTNPLADGKDTFTRDEIEEIHKSAVDTGVFVEWLKLEPTSIQCHLVKDQDRLFNLTHANVNKAVEGISDEVERYLEDNSND